MASIIFTFNDDSGTASAQFDMSQADMDRIVNAHRVIYPNPDGTPSNKNVARKTMVKAAVRDWRTATKTHEQVQAADTITDIPITEPAP